MQIEIKNLLDCQEHLPVLAELLYQEISRHWVKDSSVSKAMDKLTMHLNRNSMPLALVALSDGKPIGMACLRETDGIMPGVSPWLGSLVVDPTKQGMGVGRRLIESVKSQARIFSYDKLYLLALDRTIPNWYARLGWMHIGDDVLFGHPVSVMSISI